MLKSPDVSEEDKEIIKNKMLTKPWTPYVFRYTALTVKAASGQLNEYQLREHADWTSNSQMPRKYLKLRGNESIKALRRAHGIVPIGEEQHIPEGTLAPALICYNCKEPNKAGSRICSNPNCKMILSFEVQTEMIEKTENTRKELEEVKAQMTVLQANTSSLIKVLGGLTNEVVIHTWKDKQELMHTAKKIEEAATRRNLQA